eukprot:2080756-Alexandrium_andersonii.AAC.1
MGSGGSRVSGSLRSPATVQRGGGPSSRGDRVSGAMQRHDGWMCAAAPRKHAGASRFQHVAVRLAMPASSCGAEAVQLSRR